MAPIPPPIEIGGLLGPLVTKPSRRKKPMTPLPSPIKNILSVPVFMRVSTKAFSNKSLVVSIKWSTEMTTASFWSMAMDAICLCLKTNLLTALSPTTLTTITLLTKAETAPLLITIALNTLNKISTKKPVS